MGFKVDFTNMDWGAEDFSRARGRPEDLEHVQRALDKAVEALGGRVRVSKQGRPYAVFSKDDTTYSLHYNLNGMWSLFYPFPSWGADSKRLAFNDFQEVIDYFG